MGGATNVPQWVSSEFLMWLCARDVAGTCTYIYTDFTTGNDDGISASVSQVSYVMYAYVYYVHS